MTTEINNNSLIVPSLTATNMSVAGIIYSQGGLEVGSGGTASLYIESGKVGVNTETPNEHLTVVGNISATNEIYASGGNSNDWNSAYNAVKTLQVYTAKDNQPPSSNFATLDTRNSIAVLDFDDANVESSVFVGFIPSGADLASGLKVRIAWMATSATSGNVRWGVQLENSNTDLDSDSFDTAAEVTSTANGTSGIVTTAEITATAIDSLVAGNLYRLKVYRKANDATNDTMTGDAELIAVEVRSAA